MLWLLVTILSYLILAVVFLTDKYFLTGPVKEPIFYAFYIGILGIVIIFLAPFINLYIPDVLQFVLSLIAGAVFIYANLWFYKALKNFEASSVVPAVGGMVPIFTFVLIYVFSQGQNFLSGEEILSFVFLVFGSILITLDKEKINWRGFKISSLAALLFSLSFVLTKYVFLVQPFWNGFFWIKIGGVLMAITLFLYSKEIRNSFFQRTYNFKEVKKKTIGFFLSVRISSAGANILQNWAVALVPVSYVAIVNALQGIQYVFLLAFAVLFSKIYSQWAKSVGLKEIVSGRILFQKITAILLIIVGLIILSFN